MTGSRGLRLVGALVALAVLPGCTSRVFEVPAAYTGWVVIKHGIQGCPALPVEQGQAIHRVPASGVLCTSDPKEEGRFHRDRHFEVGAERTEIPRDGPATARRVWSSGDGEVSGDAGTFQYDAFFVGTWAQHEADPLGQSRLLGLQP